MYIGYTHVHRRSLIEINWKAICKPLLDWRNYAKWLIPSKDCEWMKYRYIFFLSVIQHLFHIHQNSIHFILDSFFLFLVTFEICTRDQIGAIFFSIFYTINSHKWQCGCGFQNWNQFERRKKITLITQKKCMESISHFNFHHSCPMKWS